MTADGELPEEAVRFVRADNALAFQLETPVVKMEKLPESEWPGNPGDPFWGIMGTTRDVIVGWKPCNWTGWLRSGVNGLYIRVENGRWNLGTQDKPPKEAIGEIAPDGPPTDFSCWDALRLLRP